MRPELKNRFAETLAHRSPGTFHFREIYGPDWEDLSIGDRVKLGNVFLRMVRNATFPDVRDTGQKNAGGRIYVKTG
ncbi:DUF1413 domain-containing protein [Roseibium aggregatum]|uniref:DUF1413 domain-containing protein n=1 Tax=Roseibium aggregatum TaxID=187304 RepID=A0A939ECW5_9HYPH|nr:DUF1413 domain-containing protein [Roseibium aggregatum]MBN9670850.1 DUF1413 domain-containing protein [Roseibium aggregatum]